MKRYIFLALSLFSISLFSQQIELKDITYGKYAQKGTEATVSSADGDYFFKTDQGKSMIIKYAYKTGLPVDTVFNTKKARDCDFDSFEGFLISPDEKRLLVYKDAESIYRRSFKANYYYYDIRRNLVRKLTDNTSKQMVPVFSRDGRMLAYVVDNNIWLAKFDFETESQVTKDGEAGQIINGATDWVYEEEFTTTHLIDFSPDNKLLAFVRFDETQVPEFSFQNFKQQLYPTLTSFKYPKAGEKNSDVTCNVFDIESKTIRKMNIPENNMEYIPQIRFTNDSQLAVMTLNRDQNDFNMYFVNPRSAVSRLILHEQNDRYIDSELLKNITFLNDQFVYLSEKDGYSHIYLYSNAGVQQKQLTSGTYDVTSILAVDPISKNVFFESAEESPLRRSIYKVDMVKGVKTKLSSKVGYNTASFGNNGKYFVNRWSDASTPTVITVNDANGKELRVLEDNKALKNELSKLTLPKKEFMTIKTNNGQELNAWMLKPSNFNPNKQYPLVMVQYSGPNSQEVVDRFSIDWVDYLVTQGFIVASVDGRGTGARGEEFRKCTYMNLGIKESDDQIASAYYFGNLPYIDQNRIAIWGWSYGGYNVLMSMSRSDVFKAGVAIAPVTKWGYYDSVYTERFMRTPQQNAQGYRDGAPVTLVDHLSGNLLLIHGTADDNVHFNNTMDYADALIKADKQFEMFVFPDKDHSIRGGHNRAFLYKKVIDFLKRSL